VNIDPSTVAAGLSAIAAVGSAVAAIKLLSISDRTADATDKAAEASREAAAATEALRLLEVERGHGDLAPWVELAWVVVEPGRLAIELRNQIWRGYRATKITMIANPETTNESRQDVGMSDTLPSRGRARFWPTPMHPGSRSGSALKNHVERISADQVVEIRWAPDGLWTCPCDRPADAHWIERRQLPAPPETNTEFEVPSGSAQT
jgi:hypothetical protein